MVKSLLAVYHQGLKSWIIQRVTSVFMVIYILGLAGFFATHPDIEFPDWHNFFSYFFVKLGTILFISSLILHAWVGIWTILTDYVKSFSVRLMLEVIVFLALAMFFFAGLFILFSV